MTVVSLADARKAREPLTKSRFDAMCKEQGIGGL